MPQPPFRALLAFVDGSYVDRDARDLAIERMHRRDPRGDRLHLAAACLGLFMLSGPVSVTEFAFAPLLVLFVLRAPHAGAVWVHGFGQPAVLIALALAAWMGVTLLWSPDPAQGADEIGRLRWLLLPGLVFPVIERRAALTAALAGGVLVAGVAQLASGFDALRPPFETRFPGRVSGWWDPVVAGSMQCAAVGLFLPAALRGAGRWRWFGLAGLGVALVGVLASGTRGAWIAAGVLVLVATPLILRRAPRAQWRAAVCVLGAGAVVLGAAAWAQREEIGGRVGQARAELAAAAAGDLDTMTGARIAIMRLALESGVTRPWGLGAGGVRSAAAARFGPEHAAAGMDHAHSSLLHLLGTAGLPGLLLGVLFVWTVWRAARRAERGSDGVTVAAGLPYALLGLVLAGQFDAVHVNTQTCALLGALAALSPAAPPFDRFRGSPSGTDP